MAGKLATSRLRKELAAYHLQPPGPHMIVACDESNMLSWSYLLQGPPGTPYENGWYWGKLDFPENYPLAPPSVMMHTPSGRFQPDTRLCLSVSDYHPESWKPAWGFATVLEGLRTFMGEDSPTIGSIDPLPSAEERRRLAAASAEWNQSRFEFRAAFAQCSRLQGTSSHSSSSAEVFCQVVGEGDCSQLADLPEMVPPDFLCGICVQLLLEPTSSSCGHTFCRTCIANSVDYHSKCPVCLAPLIGGQSVNVVVQSLIASQCPKTLAKRKSELKPIEPVRASRPILHRDAEMLTLLRVDEGNIPFPHANLDINLETPQAQEAIEQAVRATRTVLVLGRRESAAFAEFGCSADVLALERPAWPAHARSGTLLLRLRGKHRCRIVEETQFNDAGIELGRVKAVFDDALSAEELAVPNANEPATGSVLHIANDLLDLLDAGLADVGEDGRRTFQHSFGNPPVPADAAITSASIEQLSFWFAAALVATPERRRLWLLSTNTRARLEDCKACLITRKSCALNLPGVGSWMNTMGGFNSVILMLILAVLLAAKAIGLV